MTNKSIKRIPYGVADYRRLQEDNNYYVDKTHFIPLIEDAPYYLFCIRPRRFGKSLWLSLLQHYYDINLREDFEALFGDTFIGQHPTAERNSYLVLSFNFALVNPDLPYLQPSFETHLTLLINGFLHRYSQFFSEEECQTVRSHQQAADQMQQIFFYVGVKGLKLYLFIDEYDNFANTILTKHGRDAYRKLTHEDGFFRYFFNMLKGGTGGPISGLTRLYITGVSPITMDDVTSGFNVGGNISLEEPFNELIGFTEAEVRTALTYYSNAGILLIPVEKCFTLMKLWYNNYRFSQDSDNQLFNSNLVFYFLEKARERTKLPRNLIDQNLRVDYAKLRHLVTVDRLLQPEAETNKLPADRELNGNFSILKSIVDSGETVSDIAPSFPLESLLKPENFISQLYYFGLLTFTGERAGRPLLSIPNRTVADLLYSYIRDALEDANHFRLDPWQLANLLSDMAYHGNWQPFFDLLADAIQKQTAVRDYLSGEKVIQGFLLAYLNVTHFFHIWSEKDMGNGFADLYLEPFLARYPDMQYGYLIELEYIGRSSFTKKKLQEKILEAQKQLQQYGRDPRIQEMTAQRPIKKLILVYNGWELVYKDEWVDPGYINTGVAP
ncbi:MAG: AAA family ATPase [Chloroflexota bacterium]